MADTDIIRLLSVRGWEGAFPCTTVQFPRADKDTRSEAMGSALRSAAVSKDRSG
jgi:hypothetical protein